MDLLRKCACTVVVVVASVSVVVVVIAVVMVVVVLLCSGEDKSVTVKEDKEREARETEKKRVREKAKRNRRKDEQGRTRTRQRGGREKRAHLLQNLKCFPKEKYLLRWRPPSGGVIECVLLRSAPSARRKGEERRGGARRSVRVRVGSLHAGEQSE